MAIPIVSIKYEGEKLFSPFSGQLVQCDGEWNESDTTLLFAFLGDPGSFGQISPRFLEALGLGNDQVPDDSSPIEIAERLAIDGAFVLEVDAGWNGINYYCFAPSANGSLT